MKSKRALVCSVFVVCLSLSLSSLLAQSSGTGALTGTVTDMTGAVIPNVTVTVTSAETNQSRSVTTGSDGSYKITLLPPGSYNVRFTANGFKATEVPSISIGVTETPVLDRSLEVGQQTEQVTVEAQAETLQRASSTLGTTVGTATVSSLPLANRNFTQILGLSAGTNVAANNATAFGKGTMDISVNGNDPGQNNFQMDGVAVNNIANLGSANDTGIYGGISIPNPDSIQEFKIQTSTYDASYGRNPGANVNVVTKSGTNSFHGTAFEFFRNAQMNANNFFYNRDTCVKFSGSCPKQVLNQNQYGGVLGGPIKKDKLFFFASYQGTASKNAVASQGNAAGVALPPIPNGTRSGDAFVSQLIAENCHAPGLVNGGFAFPLSCSAGTVSPQALAILNLKNPDGSYYFPSSNGITTAFSQPAIFNENQGILNGDWLINAKNSLAMRYFYSGSPRTIPFYPPFGGALPDSPESYYSSNTNGVLKLTTIVSNTLVNEARVSYQRLFAQVSDQLPQGSAPSALGITPIIPTQTQAPIMTFLFNNFTAFGFLDPSFSPVNQVQVADQISWSHGKHTIRAGFEYEDGQWNLVFGGLERGWLFLGSFSNLLAGGPGNILQCLFCVRSGPTGIIHAYREHNLNSFVQDDWKVSSKLTLNVGVRWEYDGTFGDKYGNLTNTWLSQLAPNSQVPTAPLGTSPNYAGWVVAGNYVSHYGQPPNGVLINSSGNGALQDHPPLSNFGPRIGLAYSASSKLVIRAGAGVFYDRIGADRFVHSVEQGDPYAITLDYSGAAAGSFTIANPFPAQPLVGSFAQRYNNPTADCLANPTPILGTCTSNLNVPFMNQVIHTPLVRQYNVNFQYEFAPRWILEVGYVGSSGINLVDYNHNYNTALIATPSNPVNGITTTTVNNALFRVPYAGYQPVGLQGTAYDAVSNYNSLQVTVRKSFSRGLTMQASYTWSKSLTDLLGTSANSNNASDLAQQYGPAGFNRPNRFVINYSWDLPFGKHNGAAGKLLDGWNLSGVTVIQDGVPLNFYDPAGGSAYGVGAAGSTQTGWSRPQMCPGMTYSNIGTSGGIESRLGGVSGGPGYLNPAVFCPAPVIGSDGIATGYGNTGVGPILGPGQFNFDASLLKTTKITESTSVQFRAEFFNLFNHPQFNNPGSSTLFSSVNLIDTATIGTCATCTGGQITYTSVNPRVVQLALKFIF